MNGVGLYGYFFVYVVTLYKVVYGCFFVVYAAFMLLYCSLWAVQKWLLLDWLVGVQKWVSF